MRTFALALLICINLLAIQVYTACVDGTNNVIHSADASSNNVIQVSNAIGNTYDSNKTPSCYKNLANVILPGIVNLISGEINVTQKLKVIGNSKVLLTLKKNSFLVGYVCKDGKSANFLVPESYCSFDGCTISPAGCAALEKPGVHKLGDLEGDLGINGTLPLPSIPSSIKAIIKGQWQLEVKLQVGDQIVMHVKSPSDTTWLWLDE